MRFACNLRLSSALVVLLGLTLTISSGCGGGHHVISVMFSTAPPNSLQAGANAPIVATVMNDPANKGVNWSCMPAGACGMFVPAQTLSGAMTTFTAPQAIPAGGSVNIIATSVADNTKMAMAMVTITAPPAIAVTFGNPAPPASINTSAQVMIVANVANDPQNKGVNWSCLPATACGTFVPTPTASGMPTMFTAPGTVPQGGNTLRIIATSVADPTKSAAANVALSAPATESVTITQFPAQLSLATGGNAMFGAVIANGAPGEQVNWTCTPNTPAGACGSFNPMTTASGMATTYTAPPSVPPGSQVNIIATSSINGVVSPSVVLVIFTAGSNNARLKGQYAFSLNGQVLSTNLPTIGSLTLDGNGNVTAGEFDQPGRGTGNSIAVPLTGTYSVGADGRGTMNLTFSPDGVNEFPIGLNFALTSNSHGVIVETDGLFSASGSLDLQSAGPNFSLAQITGGYSFVLAGVDITVANGAPAVSGGIFTADGAGNLKNGTFDLNDAGTLSSTAFTGTVTTPDTFGHGTITLSNGFTLSYYIVTPEVLRLVQTDQFFTTGGSAYGQGSLAVANVTNAQLSGSFVFGVLGQGPSSPFGTATAGQFTTDGNGTFTAGIADSVSADGATVNAGVALTNSTYSFTGSPRGSVSIVGGVATLLVYLTDPTLNLLDPNNASGGGGALIIQNDANAFVAGMALPQGSPASAAFSGNYAVNMTGLQNTGLGVDFELDLSGEVAASGGNSYSGSADFSGTALNFTTSASQLDPAVTGEAIMGTFNADGTNPGRFTGTLTITQPAVAAGTPPYFVGLGAGSTATNAVLGLSYYQASSTQIVFIQTDGGEVALGFLEQ